MAGAWREWLKFKSQQAKLGTSTQQLEVDVKRLTKHLEEENAALTRRVQNLEAIVTSVDWDHQTALDAPKPLLSLEPTTPTDEQKAATLAQRVR